MRLDDLLDGANLQGDIRVSVWDSCGDEIAVREFRGVETLRDMDFFWGKSTDIWGEEIDYMDWLWMEINYIFAPGDGFLHIELQKKED